MNNEYKTDTRMMIEATSIVLTILALIIGAWWFFNHEVGSTAYQFEWTGKGWHVSDSKTLPTNISSPYGFMHNNVLVGSSYTLVVPHSRLGDNQVRVHIWK